MEYIFPEFFLIFAVLIILFLLIILLFPAFFSMNLIFSKISKTICVSSKRKRYSRGLVIGKFYPLHKGHNYLINTALENCESLIIIVCERRDRIEIPPGYLRKHWITEIHKSESLKEILLIEDHYDQDDSRLWAELTLNWIRPIYGKYDKMLDVVFTSEKYGGPYSEYLTKKSGFNVKHHEVDLNRETVPISGTKIRNNPYDFLTFLHPIVRMFYIKKFVLVGFNTFNVNKIGNNVSNRIKLKIHNSGIGEIIKKTKDLNINIVNNIIEEEEKTKENIIFSEYDINSLEILFDIKCDLEIKKIKRNNIRNEVLYLFIQETDDEEQKIETFRKKLIKENDSYKCEIININDKTIEEKATKIIKILGIY